jgi:hypothetical protein
LIAVLLVVAATACTPAADKLTSTAPTTEPTASTTTSSTTVPGTTTSIPPPESPPTEPPQTGDPDLVAFNALRNIDGYTTVFGPSEQDIELAELIDKWIPEVLVNGLALDIVANEDAEHVIVVSISPLTGLRGYPWIAALFGLFADEDAANPETATEVVEVNATTGGTFFLWGEGDGLMITTAEDPAAASRYIEAFAATDERNAVWSAGDCLYLPQDEPDFYGNAPWAPFPLDLVVPCSGPHNAEVLESMVAGTDLTTFDGPQIAFDRSYVCDKAYASEFGNNPQGEYLPSLITYMPDSDEWDRGDRYLACVVYIGDVGGAERLFIGPMRDLPDLEWSIDPGSCTEDSGKLKIACAASHRYQFLGSIEYSEDSYDPSSTELDEACEELDHAFTEGPNGVEVIVVGFDPGPYQFELGHRTVNCYAAAYEDFGAVEVTGSFFDTWRVVDEDAVSS